MAGELITVPLNQLAEAAREHATMQPGRGVPFELMQVRAENDAARVLLVISSFNGHIEDGRATITGLYGQLYLVLK